MSRDRNLHHIERLRGGSATYPAMMRAINGARSSIHWANYCFERGQVGQRFYAPLAAAARRGVAVRLLVDSFGSADLTPQTLERLRAAGIEVVVFGPFQAGRPWRYNHRLHKKLLIVDNTLGFTGGVGVADFWLDPPDYPSSWRDTHFAVTGPTVTAMQQAFMQSWNRFGPTLELTAARRGGAARPAGTPAAGRQQPQTEIATINSLPRGRQLTAAGRTLVALIDASRRDLVVTTPYLTPNRAVRSALRRAARRQVRVRILTNGPYCTHPIARDASRHLYARLLKAGIRLYEYQPTKIHTKTLLVDGRISFIGSANLSFRSARHDEEFNLVVRDRQLAAQLNRDFEHDLKSAQEIRRSDWKRPPSLKLRHAASSLGRYFF